MKKWFNKRTRTYSTPILLVLTNKAEVSSIEASLLHGVALIDVTYSGPVSAVGLLVGESENLILEQAAALIYDGYHIEVCSSEQEKFSKLKYLFTS